MPYKDPEKQREYIRKWREENPDYMPNWRKNNPEKVKAIAKRSHEKHREKNNERSRQAYWADPESRREYRRDYYAEKPEKVLEANRKQYYKRVEAGDVQFKLARNLRSRLNIAIKNGYKVGSAVSDLGCSIPEFKDHLERQFQEGMTWGNWGLGEEKWHIDHIVPLSAFDLTDREQFLKACHFTNLQPLWQEENLRKGNKGQEK